VLGEIVRRRRDCLIKKKYLGNFFQDNCEIKILYGVQEEGMGVKEEFVSFYKARLAGVRVGQNWSWLSFKILY